MSHVFLPAFQPGGQVIKAVTDNPEAPRSAKETKDKVIDLVWPEVEKVPTCANLDDDHFGPQSPKMGELDLGCV